LADYSPFHCRYYFRRAATHYFRLRFRYAIFRHISVTIAAAIADTLTLRRYFSHYQMLFITLPLMARFRRLSPPPLALQFRHASRRRHASYAEGGCRCQLLSAVEMQLHMFHCQLFLRRYISLRHIRHAAAFHCFRCLLFSARYELLARQSISRHCLIADDATPPSPIAFIFAAAPRCYCAICPRRYTLSATAR
jgi:hypothetical protein